jgi:hypothetical protein
MTLSPSTSTRMTQTDVHTRQKLRTVGMTEKLLWATAQLVRNSPIASAVRSGWSSMTST